MAASIRNANVSVRKIVRIFGLNRHIYNGTRLLQTATTSDTDTSTGVVESTEEYAFVERLIPSSRIPKPPKHDGPTPSGWSPNPEVPPDLPYMIRRSRMHNVPVYTDIKNGSQKSTVVRKVEGDIWALEKDMKDYLMEVTGRVVPTQVNEVTGSIRVKGHVDKELKEWLGLADFAVVQLISTSLISGSPDTLSWHTIHPPWKQLTSQLTMESIVRQKLPSRLRSMLTDIGPKEEKLMGAETEQEPVEKDGIVLPRRGASNTSELLAPAMKNETTNDGSVQQVCGLCLSQPYSYTCPRCNIMYCSLACYRSPGHSGCSEEFYKESVFEELRNSGLTEKEGREKMHEILLRLRKNEGQMEHITEELGEEVEPGGTEALELLCRLAEIQASGEEKTEEVQDILLKLRDINKGEDRSNEHGLMQEKADQEDLADRLAGLDIDSLSEEELWALLSQEDREKFERLVKGGVIGGLIPIWRPWWEVHDKSKEVLLEVLSEDTAHEQDETSIVPENNRVKEVSGKEGREAQLEKTECVTGLVRAKKTDESVKVKHVSKSKNETKQKNKGQVDTNVQGNKPSSRVPPVNMSKIPPLHSLTTNPSPLLGNTLVNVLYGYTFSLCLFNGDISEKEMTQDFCQMVLAISEGLSTARVFSTLQEALEVAVTAVSAGGYFDREDPQAPARAVEAVAHVLSGRSSRDSVGYCLAALAQLRDALAKARGLLPKEGESAELRKRCFQAMKKCEFLQSWAKENTQVVKILSAGVWREHFKRENEWRILEEEKKGAEQSRRKIKGKGPLIEEISTK
ncbi:hypothetical protein ACEWY4_009984 [Coilia grayii]|uniref:Large ribosomal subunit protein mL49 n=1 Tax=Coilia grayii TaxID=363190 RepID=A0ABD1K7Y6_9TELE